MIEDARAPFGDSLAGSLLYTVAFVLCCGHASGLIPAINKRYGMSSTLLSSCSSFRSITTGPSKRLHSFRPPTLLMKRAGSSSGSPAIVFFVASGTHRTRWPSCSTRRRASGPRARSFASRTTRRTSRRRWPAFATLSNRFVRLILLRLL